MDLLQVRNGKVVDAQGQEVRLRGTCVGGWMNMENFINGYPGAEHALRTTMAETIGESKAHFFFERMLDYFLSEDDIAFMKAQGTTVVRLSFNYRHFELDAEPFKYLDSGFARLEKAIGWCAKHGLYAILDLHAVRSGADPHSEAAIAFGVTGAPETFVVDQHGIIRYKQIGPITPEVWKKTLAPM
ncbi:MAG: cellulase family glycosylhydrolase, partial [Anaerolineae bacterium]